MVSDGDGWPIDHASGRTTMERRLMAQRQDGMADLDSTGTPNHPGVLAGTVARPRRTAAGELLVRPSEQVA